MDIEMTINSSETIDAKDMDAGEVCVVRDTNSPCYGEYIMKATADYIVNLAALASGNVRFLERLAEGIKVRPLNNGEEIIIKISKGE